MLVYAWMPTRWGFYLLAPVHGAVWSALLTSSSAHVGGNLPAQARARGMSIFGLASPSGTILGPTVGVWIYGRWGFAVMCLSLAFAFAALVVGGRALPVDDERRVRPARLVVRPDASVLPLAIILFFLAVGYGSLSTYSTQEGIEQAFRFCDRSWPSAFLSSLGVGMVIMRACMGLIGFGRRPERLLPGMVLLSMAGLCLLAFVPGGIARHIASGLLYGAGYSMVFTLLNTILLGTVPTERRGAAFGTFVFAFDAGIGLGSFGLGRVIGMWGFHTGWTVAVIVLICGLPSALRVARRQHLPPVLTDERCSPALRDATVARSR
jgi:predicted MFS family arabinose efflux permease